MNDTISISDARANIPDIVEQVSTYLNRIWITVHGQKKAVVMSAEELESLEETAEILAIPGARESIQRGLDDMKKGRGIPLSDLP